VLFVGTKPQAQDIVAEEAGRAGQYYVVHRWLGGTMTNFKTIRQTLERFKALEHMEEDGTMDALGKKEQLRLRRERDKLERNLGGIREMSRLPGALFVVDPVKDRIPVAEANKLGVPVVAIADSNCDPDVLDHIIPSNDDALRAIRLITTRLADACVEGDREHQAKLTGGGDKPEPEAKADERAQSVIEVIIRDPGPAGADQPATA
jgi:small subunit ribosomal protein S2